MRHLVEYRNERKELIEKVKLYNSYVTDDGSKIKSEIYNERKYHSLPGPYAAIEFKATSKKAAIKQFNERNELR